MIHLFIYLISVTCQQIYSLQENLICEFKPCDEEIKQYNFGIETFGDLTNTPFTLQFQFNLNGAGTSFIASINDGQTQLAEIASVQTNYSGSHCYFKITTVNSYELSQDFQNYNWFQLIITETIIQICDSLNCFIINHNQTIFSSTIFNFLNSTQTAINNIKACCIIMYKGISYPNNQLITFQNTKYPEVVIDMNIQEKIQSNITLDYSDYKYIAKLGDLFDYDQNDPYLIDDGFLFNASQYIQINQIVINPQCSFEFRLQILIGFSSNIILLNYTQTSRIYIFINGSSITYKLNSQSQSFLYLQQTYIHFCIGITQLINQSPQQIYFFQFSDTDILSVQTQNISDYLLNHENGFGYLNIGSKQNQFNFGEYFNLYHFRYYQGFFMDDQSVMQTNCQIYLNDRCIICKTGYLLLNDNTCALECDSSSYQTALISSHNQCQRKCHPRCATCNSGSPQICLICSGIRISPPSCICPNNYFEDNVSPNCRKYYPDTSVQSGTFSNQCMSLKVIQFGFQYKIKPTIIISFLGTSTIYNRYDYTILYKIEVSLDSFIIRFHCDLTNQLYVINWMSSIGNNLIQSSIWQLDGNKRTIHTYQSSQLIMNGASFYPIYVSSGFEYLYGNETKFCYKQSYPNASSISFNASPNTFDWFGFYYFYTQFKIYDISDITLDTQIDDQPKSIQQIIIQRGFSIESYDKFIYQSNKRTSTYFSIKSVYNKTMQIYDWLLILASHQCNNNQGACDFYESYTLNCNNQLSFCLYEPENYFVNQSSLYFQQCDVSCKTCFGISSNCTSCYIDLTLRNNRCLYNCDPNCLQCIPTLNINCTKCVPFATLNSTNGCQCDVSYFFDDETYLCLECSKQCLTCSINNKTCTSCPEFTIKNETTCYSMDGYYFDENYQIQECQKNCKTCINNFKCLSCINSMLIFATGQCYCEQGYYFDDYLQCSQCKKHCQDCSNDQCLQCTSDKILYDNSCICSFDRYLDVYEICQDCNIKCRTCYGPLENQCLTCKFDRELSVFNSCKCLTGYQDVEKQQECEKCPVNCLECAKGQCTKCGPNLTPKNGLCQCPEGYYEQDGRCISCDTKSGKYMKECNYKNCSDKIYTISEECDDGNLIDYDGCTRCKIDPNYQCFNQVDNVSICYKCQKTCIFCSLEDFQVICKKCSEGYFLNNNQCLECSQNCRTCQSYNQCTQCPIINTNPDEQLNCPVCDYGSFLQIDQCQTKCGDGIITYDEECDDGNINSSDGCNSQCRIEESFVCENDQGKSNCFNSNKPKLLLNNLIKVTDSQYKVHIICDQLVKLSNFNVKVNLQNQSNYNYTYDVIHSQRKQQYSLLEINITINLSISANQLIFQILIEGDIHNKYGQILDKFTFVQQFQNIYILMPQQAQNSQILTNVASKMFYVALSLSIFQVVFSDSLDSVSTVMKTQNYLQYLRYISIDYPPNIMLIFNQFADSNVLQFLDIQSLVSQIFNINIRLDQFSKNTPLFYNKHQVNTSFLVNIYLFTYTLIQGVLIIKLSLFIAKLVQTEIESQILTKNTFNTKLIRCLSFGQFHLIRTIYVFRQNGIKQLFFVAQYNIYFALFIKLKVFQFDTFFEMIELVITILSSIICALYVFRQTKGQSVITIIRNINAICFIFCIVFLYDFQLQQLLIISMQSLMLVILLLQEGTSRRNQFTVLTFLTSINYIYNPFDIDQIFVGFLQLVAILSSLVVNMLMQLRGLYSQFIKQNSQKPKEATQKIEDSRQ